jgi:hypothetical protein
VKAPLKARDPSEKRRRRRRRRENNERVCTTYERYWQLC